MSVSVQRIPSEPAQLGVDIPTLHLLTTTPDQLVAALAASSCVFLTGHGVADKELAAFLRSAVEFFGQSEAEKEPVRWPGSGPWRGWQPVYQGGPNAMLLERFEINLQPGGQHRPPQEWADTFTMWPSQPAGMASAWTAIYAQLHHLASQLTTAIAAGLLLPNADLPAWTERQFSNLVVNHYLRQEQAPEPGRVRQRPHTDIGGITLLWADESAGGLEARIGPDGGWVPVSVPSGCLLLQAGDLLNLWTAGRIPANMHRVVNPPRAAGVPQTDRYSAVFFHHPDLTTWVAPAAEQPADHGAAEAGDAAPSGVDARVHVLARQQLSGQQDALAP